MHSIKQSGLQDEKVNQKMHLVLQFSCSVSTFRANSSYSRSAPKESESFFAGLKVNVLNDNLHQEGLS